jgi:hypothetical protein
MTAIHTSGGSQYLKKVCVFDTPDESGIPPARQPEIFLQGAEDAV